MQNMVKIWIFESFCLFFVKIGCSLEVIIFVFYLRNSFGVNMMSAVSFVNVFNLVTKCSWFSLV